MADPVGIRAAVWCVLGRGIDKTSFLLGHGEGFAEDSEVVEEDTLEGLGVLTAALGGVAGVLQDPVCAYAGPGAAARSGPASGCNDVFD